VVTADGLELLLEVLPLLREDDEPVPLEAVPLDDEPLPVDDEPLPLDDELPPLVVLPVDVVPVDAALTAAVLLEAASRAGS
jgi:hypothetical protein